MLVKRRMEQFEVYTNEGGGISIRQDQDGEDVVIAVHVKQVPALAAWLIECATEMDNLEPPAPPEEPAAPTVPEAPGKH